MTFILWAIVAFILYRFVTGFLIPVVRTTSQVKKQFNAMRQQMEQAQQQYQQQAQGAQTTQQTNAPGTKGKYDIEGEYIPFEDVK
ncbi:DUF4834 family protein [Phnomibacter sp. MR]|jgi:Domain of unknown function (DUF4834)|uniref:DUF4834 family protein n=1 Tax=Phnomibacter sp. MR TaxID=3042318 RepID=UPI003A7F9083|nr:DUF4834 family protein [Chitinophagaceae bacterium]